MQSASGMAAEVWRQVDLLAIKGRRRMQAVAGIACLLAVGGLALAQARHGVAGAGPPTAAAGNIPLMFPDIGGYVLAGAICFALGCAVALLCMGWKARKK